MVFDHLSCEFELNMTAFKLLINSFPVANCNFVVKKKKKLVINLQGKPPQLNEFLCHYFITFTL